MNKKPILCLLLALVMLLSLAACGMDTKPAEEPQSQEADTPPAHEELPVETPAPTPEAAHEVDPLLQALFLSLPSIRQDDSRQWRYAVTDLDHNGRFEILAATQHQADRATTLKLWELSENHDALLECSIPLQEDESFPDILSDNTDTFYNASTNTWSYLFYDTILLSENEAYTAKCAVTLKDQTLRYESFAFQYVSSVNGQHIVNFIGLDGKEISPEDYNSAGQLAFFGWEKSSTNFGWFSYEDATDATCLEESLGVFNGERTPDKTNPLPVPQPLGQVDPQGPSSGSAPLFLYVTKNPTNERLSRHRAGRSVQHHAEHRQAPEGRRSLGRLLHLQL